MDILSIIVVSLVTFAAIVAGFYAYGMSHLREIKQNWVQYRCNPVYMPLAGAVGSDIFTNFTHCTMQSVQTYAGFVMDPLYQNFEMFQGIFTQILDMIQSIRKQMAGAVDGFMSIISQTFGKLVNTLGITTLLVGRVRTIMNRIISVFVVMIHIAMTGIQSGMSLKNGPIGKTAEFLCFHGDTPIRLLSGQILPIRALTLGDVLEDGGKVTSVMMFDGSETAMVCIRGVRVSGNHKILHHGEWIPCSEHPEAISLPTTQNLFCLTTTYHTIPIEGMIFRDYEEIDDVGEFYRDVGEFYGSAVPPLRYTYRTTGFHLNTPVRMADGTIKQISHVDIGERVSQGGRVIGVLYHAMDTPYAEPVPRIFTAPGTILIRQPGELITAATVTFDSTLPPGVEHVCMNLLTEHALVSVVDMYGMDYTFLDDQEVPDPALHEKRDQKVLGE